MPDETVVRAELENRHPAVQDLMRFLTPNPNLPDRLKPIVGEFFGLACTMLALNSNDNPELTTGLRKLLEAKDCFVRAAL
jgi:hypothetical protein